MSTVKQSDLAFYSLDELIKEIQRRAFVMEWSVEINFARNPKILGTDAENCVYIWDRVKGD